MDNGTYLLHLNSTHSRIDQGGKRASNPLKTEETIYLNINMTGNNSEGISLPDFTRTVTNLRVTNDVCISVSSEIKEIKIYP